MFYRQRWKDEELPLTELAAVGASWGTGLGLGVKKSLFRIIRIYNFALHVDSEKYVDLPHFTTDTLLLNSL